MLRKRGYAYRERELSQGCFLYCSRRLFTSERSASARIAASCEVDSGRIIANSSPP